MNWINHTLNRVLPAVYIHVYTWQIGLQRRAGTSDPIHGQDQTNSMAEIHCQNQVSRAVLFIYLLCFSGGPVGLVHLYSTYSYIHMYVHVGVPQRVLLLYPVYPISNEAARLSLFLVPSRPLFSFFFLFFFLFC